MIKQLCRLKVIVLGHAEKLHPRLRNRPASFEERTFACKALHRIWWVLNISFEQYCTTRLTSFWIVRQAILCTADTTLEQANAKGAFNAEGAIHQCRDWNLVKAFLEDNRVDDATSSILDT